MVANITNIPAARVPFIDDKTGLISREWYRFLFNLFTLTGGGGTTMIDSSISAVAGVIDQQNSTNTPLAGGGVYTGAWVNVLNYGQIQITAFSDVASSATGLEIQFSMDGVHVDHTHDYVISAGAGETVQMQPHEQYYRVIYTNGAAPQTAFRLQTLLRPIAGNGSILEAGKIISSHDDCLLTKSILTGQSVIDGTYINAKMTPDGGLVVNQDIQIDPLNSSTTNLAASATFTGSAVSNITATAIQIFLKTDQNCTVYLDQSQDGVNWDVSDPYNFYSAVGNFAITTNAVGAYYRVRVTNTGTATTTYFRLQSIIVPILSALPRTLSPEGNLKIAVESFKDVNGSDKRISPLGEDIAVPVYRLVGSLFPGSTLDTNFWTASVGTGGTVAPTDGLMTIATGTTANNATSLITNRTARMVTRQPNKFRAVVQLPDTGTANNVRRGGAFTTTDGIFFELSGTTFSLVTRKGGIDTKITNGSFNGTHGGTYVLTTSTHNFEIVYTSSTVYFYIDGVLIHTQVFNTTWSATLNLPIRFENTNSGGSTTNVVMNLFSASISRLGVPSTQPVSFNQVGTTAGVTIKNASGSIHGMIISNVTNNAVVTLYDNTAASGTVIWASGAMSNQTVPLSLNFNGIQFSTGLTVAITGAACNAMIMYE